MDDIINFIKEKFYEYGGIEIYTSYDAIPVRDKGKFFVVISVKKFESSTPIYSNTKIYMPLTTEIMLTVLSPQGSTADELFEYYNKHMEKAVIAMSGIKSRLKNIYIAPDTVSKKLALTVTLQISAIKHIDKPTE